MEIYIDGKKIEVESVEIKTKKPVSCDMFVNPTGISTMLGDCIAFKPSVSLNPDDLHEEPPLTICGCEDLNTPPEPKLDLCKPCFWLLTKWLRKKVLKKD